MGGGSGDRGTPPHPAAGGLPSGLVAALRRVEELGLRGEPDTALDRLAELQRQTSPDSIEQRTAFAEQAMSLERMGGSVAAARRICDRALEGMAEAGARGRVLLHRGRISTGAERRRYYTAALTELSMAGDEQGQALALGFLAYPWEDDDEVSHAYRARLGDDGLRLAVACGDPYAIAVCAGNLAVCEAFLGRPSALERWRQVTDLQPPAADAPTANVVAVNRVNWALTAAAYGDYAQAARVVSEGSALARGRHWERTFAAIEAVIAWRRGDLPHAWEAAERARDASRPTQTKSSLADPAGLADLDGDLVELHDDLDGEGGQDDQGDRDDQVGASDGQSARGVPGTRDFQVGRDGRGGRDGRRRRDGGVRRMRPATTAFPAAAIGTVVATACAFERESRPDVTRLGPAVELVIPTSEQLAAFALAVLARIRAVRREPEPGRGLRPALARARRRGRRFGWEDLVLGLSRIRPEAARAELAELGELWPAGRRAAAVRSYVEGLIGGDHDLLVAAGEELLALPEPITAGQALHAAAHVAPDTESGNRLRLRAVELFQAHGADRSLATVLREGRLRRTPTLPRIPQTQRSAVHAGLTPREHEVALLAQRALTAREIAERLSLAEGTVRNHLLRIRQKFGGVPKHKLGELLSPDEPNDS
jgi:DNA-binding CsgD family transcriptional regulator